MYGVVPSRQFARSLVKLERSGPFKPSARTKFNEILRLLAEGRPLSARCKDHPLKGDLHQHRECHVKDDLLLLYKKDENAAVILLADIGTHSALFGQ